MGTRSLTFVHDETGDPIVCVYQQYDGYFDGVGDDILSFLKGSRVVNGIGMDPGVIFNGAGDLAARLITHFKRGDASDAGGVYIESPTLADGDMGTEFAYHIYATAGGEPRLVARDVYSGRTVAGLASDIVWPTDRDEDEADASVAIRPDQRAALFATFTEVFGHSEEEARYAFTRMVLGHGADEVVSWSENKPGALSATEASKVLDALNLLNV
jgi:hypothetical protein